MRGFHPGHAAWEELSAGRGRAGWEIYKVVRPILLLFEIRLKMSYFLLWQE